MMEMKQYMLIIYNNSFYRPIVSYQVSGNKTQIDKIQISLFILINLIHLLELGTSLNIQLKS